MNTEDESALTPTQNIYGWSVIGPAGGRWWPEDDAQEEIAAAPDPAAAAVAMCDASPTRGRWHG